MNSQATEQLIEMLLYILIPVVIAIFALIGFWVYLHFKEKNPKKEKDAISSNSKEVERVSSTNKQSIFNFMEFDNVEDNMIIQKNGNRFLMVIGCQGVNYDLMSGLEKNGVEEGFV